MRGRRGREMMMAVIPIRPSEELVEMPDPAFDANARKMAGTATGGCTGSTAWV